MLNTVLRAGVLAAALTLGCRAHAIEPADPYPGQAPGGTQFLNHPALVGQLEDPAWFLANIPFLDVPDSTIQQVYYYRWQTYKEHLRYVSPIYGWISTEFLVPVFYSGPYGALDDAAGHHINEGRWLRDQQYVKDYINYWMNGPGTGFYAHQYSSWVDAAIWQAYLAQGDLAFVAKEVPQMAQSYQYWNSNFNPALGLYWQVPLLDATEFTPESFETSDPFAGGPGYLPTINAYQYGNALAIASIADLSGQTAIATEYATAANTLGNAIRSILWDPRRHFYYPIQRDNNPKNLLLDTKEEEGFVPFMFDVPSLDQAVEVHELFDPKGLASAFGPPTAERRSRWFDYQDAECCHWDGPSWPYQTSEMLTGAANLLIDYPKQSHLDKAKYVQLLHTYAATQFKNGVPYIAEAHDADADVWIYDTSDHSEDYNHSTFNDNVITGLIGVRGQPDNSVLVAPLAPASWDYFMLENTPYHGHNITVLWDRTGQRYGQGAGMKIYVDGHLAAGRNTVTRVTVPIPIPITQHNSCGVVNAAVNSQQFSAYTQPFASFTHSTDSVWSAIDGSVYRLGIPEDTRWTSGSSPNQSDYYGVNFQRNVTLRAVTLTFYDDAQTIRVPASYDLQYWNGSTWLSVPKQARTYPLAAANAANRITFPPLTTSQIRVVAPNGIGTWWGLSELQAFSRPVFVLQNLNSNLLAGVQNQSTADGALVQQAVDDGSVDNLWELQDAGGGYFKLLNLASHLVLGIQGSSPTAGGVADQEADTNAWNQKWSLLDAGTGQFRLVNAKSGLVLGVSDESTSTGAQLLQWTDNGTPDHLWLLKSADDPAANEPCP